MLHVIQVPAFVKNEAVDITSLVKSRSQLLRVKSIFPNVSVLLKYKINSQRVQLQRLVLG